MEDGKLERSSKPSNITAEGKAYWFSTELDNWCGEESYTWEQKDVLLSLQSMGSQISRSKKVKIENFTQLWNELRKDKILRVVQNWDKGDQNGARCSLYLGLKVIWWWHFLVYFLWAVNLDNYEYFVPKQWHMSLERVDFEELKSHIWFKNHGTGNSTLKNSPNSNDQFGQKSLCSSALSFFSNLSIHLAALDLCCVAQQTLLLKMLRSWWSPSLWKLHFLQGPNCLWPHRICFPFLQSRRHSSITGKLIPVINSCNLLED